MTAAYRIPIPEHLRSHTAQIAQEYRDGASFFDLAYKHRTHTKAIGAILVHEGVERRPRGGNRPGQPHRGPRSPHNRPRVSRYHEQEAGDRAIFAKATPRKVCPHGRMLEGKPYKCVLVGEADCDVCRFSRTAEGRVSVASSFGREFSVHGGMR